MMRDTTGTDNVHIIFILYYCIVIHKSLLLLIIGRELRRIFPKNQLGRSCMALIYFLSGFRLE